MKPGNNNRRPRGRGPRKPHGHGMGGPGKGQGYDGGGEYRVRGNAHQILERYLQLARDAGVVGDRVAAENYLQHADHYYRVLTAIHDGQRPRIGGREVSVADVNVQNVSQGLSAALSSSSSQMQAPGQIGADEREQGALPVPDSSQAPGQEDVRDFNRPPTPAPARGFGGADGSGQRPAFMRPSVVPDSAAGPGTGGSAPTASVPAVREAPADDQPDYPEELLKPATPQPSVQDQAGPAGDDESRPMRSRLRGRMRGPARRAPGPGGDGPSGDGPESEDTQS